MAGFLVQTQPDVKLQAAYFSETFVPSYQTTCHDAQGRSMHIIFLSLIRSGKYSSLRLLSAQVSLTGILKNIFHFNIND